MASEITMPRLSDSMEEGTIIKWLVSEGDEIERGQEIAEIETDKANMNFESDTAGTVLELVASEGDTLAIGEVIARVGEKGESADGSQQSAEQKSVSADEEPADEEEEEPVADENGDEPSEQETEQQPARASSDGAEGNGRVKASPVARRMAEERGIDLGAIEGSGPGGRIVKADVEAAAEGGGAATKTEEKPAEAEDGKPAEPEEKREPVPAPAGDGGNKGEVEVQELSRLQRTVSRRMAESKATAPDYQLTMEIDMTLCVELRERLKQVQDPPPSFNDMVVKAVANALREFPRVNGAYRDGKFELYSRVNVGVAVAAQDTLVVPTIFDADKKALGEIARVAREAIGKVRDGKITPPELSGGTFTVSNLGMFGIDSFTAVINPPQAAILAVGSLKKRPVVEDGGRIVARDTMSATLVCDHRILYGADGAEFLARVRELLEQPLALAL
jgi:pyruvate dehydrogenase E2 component (dihydrolipoamide acetyltransferase)